MSRKCSSCVADGRPPESVGPGSRFCARHQEQLDKIKESWERKPKKAEKVAKKKTSKYEQYQTLVLAALAKGPRTTQELADACEVRLDDNTFARSRKVLLEADRIAWHYDGKASKLWEMQTKKGTCEHRILNALSKTTMNAVDLAAACRVVPDDRTFRRARTQLEDNGKLKVEGPKKKRMYSLTGKRARKAT
jgi:hypothetical protein